MVGIRCENIIVEAGSLLRPFSFAAPRSADKNSNFGLRPKCPLLSVSDARRTISDFRVQNQVGVVANSCSSSTGTGTGTVSSGGTDAP